MTTTTPKYPDVIVKLSNRDGNCFSIMGACAAAAKKADVPKADIDAFYSEAMAGDYDQLLRTCIKYFDVR